MIGALRSELAQVVRGLRRSPGFAAAVVLVLALGLGLGIAVFAVLDAVLLRPLPFPDPDRLYGVDHLHEPSGGWSASVPAPVAEALRDTEVGGELAPYAVLIQLVRTDGPEPALVNAYGMGPELLPTLGVRPALGRSIGPGDVTPGAPPVAVVTHEYWQRELGGDPNVLDRVLRLQDRPVPVVGVLPRGFGRFPHINGGADLWLPLAEDGTVAGEPAPNIALLARVPDGQGAAAFQERTTAAGEALGSAGVLDEGWTLRATPIGGWRTTARAEQLLWLVAGAVMLMMLIAVSNAANLLLVRNARRSRALELRRALGASRGRILLHILVESLSLGLAGGAAAVLVALGGVGAIRAILPDYFLQFAAHSVTVEGRAIAFAVLTSVAAGLVFGALPALRAARRAARSGTLMGARRAGGAGGTGVLGNGLVVAQFGLSMTLLVAAGLMARSFVRLVDSDLGFDVDDRVVLDLSLDEERYPDGAAVRRFGERLRNDIETLPGVSRATVANSGPPRTTMHFGLRPETEDGGVSESLVRLLPFAVADDRFLEVLDVRLTAGSAPDPVRSGRDGVLIDQDLARFLWDDSAPVGRRFRLHSDSVWLTVTGVVDELNLRGWDVDAGRYALIYPFSEDRLRRHVTIIARGGGAATLRAIRDRVRRLDPGLPIQRLRPLDVAVAGSVEQPRFALTLMGVLSLSALVLAVFGIYGIMAHTVSTRSFEIGVRMAVGADPGAVGRLVLGRGMTLAAVGAVAGILGAVAGGRLLQGLLFQVETTDVATIAGVAVGLLLVALLGCAVPTYRATRIEPSRILKED